ncbi:hypothetical protein [Parabacteroides sp.]
MTVFQKLIKYGLIGIFKYIGQKFFATDIICVHYLCLNIDIAQIKKALNDFDLDVKELTYDDFFKGDPLVFREDKMKLYKQRFCDNTYKAYGIIENNRLVYSTWISYHRLGMTFETHPVYLAQNEGYLEDSYCDPIARGRGLHGRMNLYRIMKIYESGRSRVVAVVQHGNVPAFKVQYKSGLKEVGIFHYGQILNIKFNTLNKDKFDKNEYTSKSSIC